MARFYSNENLPQPVVDELRRLGHDVLTSYEAGNANRSVPDLEVLAFAVSGQRILLTLNRKHFLRVHHLGSIQHCGIIVCTFDPDFAGQARRIHNAVAEAGDPSGQLLRVNRPARIPSTSPP